MIGGLRAAMGYCGCRTIAEMKRKRSSHEWQKRVARKSSTRHLHYKRGTELPSLIHSWFANDLKQCAYDDIASSSINARNELAHVRYLTGFLDPVDYVDYTNETIFYNDRRYKSQAPQEVLGFKIIIAKQNLFPLLAERKLIPSKITHWFESQNISVADINSLKKTAAR